MGDEVAADPLRQTATESSSGEPRDADGGNDGKDGSSDGSDADVADEPQEDTEV